jgi:hypothetical protein
VPAIQKAAIRRAVYHIVIGGDELLQNEMVDVSSILINYGEKEYNIKCKNIEVKSVGPYWLQILVATVWDQRYGSDKIMNINTHRLRAFVCVCVCVCKVRQYTNILQLIHLKYVFLKK